MTVNRREFTVGALAAGACALIARRDEAVSVVAAGRLVHRFAPASVTRLQLTLA